MEELKAENGEYGKLEIQWIEEEQQPEQAKAYAQDYYYVPSMFVDGKKLYEAHPGESYEECKAMVQQVLDAAL